MKLVQVVRSNCLIFIMIKAFLTTFTTFSAFSNTPMCVCARVRVRVVSHHIYRW
jgi:fluoride ion exporter CrcB/FEX